MAATAIIILALFNANAALALATGGVTLDSLAKGGYCTISFCRDSATAFNQNPASVVSIKFVSNGYAVDNPVIKAGTPVTLQLVNESGYGCLQAFRIPKLGISKIVPVGSTETISITVPETGQLAFMCSMGMFRGSLNVI